MSDKTTAVRLVSDDESASRIDERIIAGVEVKLDARIGSARMTVAELMNVKSGDCITLDSALNRDVELRLNGVTVARGELVAVDTSFGVRIVEIAK